MKVSRSGQFEAFAAAIVDALRGSGLRYNELSSTLAANMSPRELLEAVDTNDFDLIAEATGITKDRAARSLGQLRECDLGALATVAVEDTVALRLLDGTDYKGIAELSTGQRCTVVLPLDPAAYRARPHRRSARGPYRQCVYHGYADRLGARAGSRQPDHLLDA